MAVVFKKKKAASEHKSYQFRRFLELGRALYLEIEYRLYSGESPQQVAAFLQEERKVLLDVKLETLKRYLHTFRTKIIWPKVAKLHKDRDNMTSTTAKKRWDQDVDALRIIRREIRDQVKRVEKIRQKEEKLPGGIVLDSLSKEKKYLTDLAERYLRIQMDAGLIDKLGNAPLVQVNNQIISIEAIQQDIVNREQIAIATQQALSILKRTGNHLVPEIPACKIVTNQDATE